MSPIKIAALVTTGVVLIGGGFWLAKRGTQPESIVTEDGRQTESSAQEDAKVFDKWLVHCLKKGEKNCVMFQNLSTEKGQRVGNITLGHFGEKGELVMIVTAPLGIVIPAGIALKIDEKEQISKSLTQCTPEGCQSVFIADQALVEELIKGRMLRVGVLGPDQKSITIPFDLAGFKDALAAVQSQQKEVKTQE